LRSRLELFLPTLKAANDLLKERVERDGFDAINVEAVDESDEHIEMVRTKLNSWLFFFVFDHSVALRKHRIQLFTALLILNVGYRHN
jgi:Domain of unknown function (DUF4598)